MTNRIDLDPVRNFPLPAAPRAALGPWSYVRKAFLQAASPNPVPCLGNPSRDKIVRVGSGQGQGGEICAAGESFATRVAVFAWIAKSRFNPGSNSGSESQKRRQSISPRMISFWRTLVPVRPGPGNPLEDRLAIRGRAQYQGPPRLTCPF